MLAMPGIQMWLPLRFEAAVGEGKEALSMALIALLWHFRGDLHP